MASIEYGDDKLLLEQLDVFSKLYLCYFKVLLSNVSFRFVYDHNI